MRMLNRSIAVIMFGLLTGIMISVLSGCATVSYEDQIGRKFSYSRFGNQAIKGLKVDQTSNSITVTIESVQNDTQALTQAVTTLAGKVKP